MQLNNLTFEALARASLSRAIRWHGTAETPPRHIPPGYGMCGWTLSDWLTATCGELGEAANLIKKLNRQRDGMRGNKDATEALLREALASELADVAIYLDLLAQSAGIDLGSEIIAKFNRTSIENNFPERLGEND